MFVRKTGFIMVKLLAYKAGFPEFNFYLIDTCLLTPLSKRGLQGMKPVNTQKYFHSFCGKLVVNLDRKSRSPAQAEEAKRIAHFLSKRFFVCIEV